MWVRKLGPMRSSEADGEMRRLLFGLVAMGLASSVASSEGADTSSRSENETGAIAIVLKCHVSEARALDDGRSDPMTIAREVQAHCAAEEKNESLAILRAGNNKANSNRPYNWRLTARACIMS